MFIAGLGQAEVRGAVAGLSELGEVTGTACDVSEEAAAADMTGAAWRGLGGVDVLINNAGTARRRPFLQITPAEWDRMLAVNLRGMFLVARAVAGRMTERGRGGVIVNMSSVNGIAGEEDYAHYNASKGGVLLLTKTMAAELGRHGIRVNALCPGYISTPLNAAIASGLGGVEAEHEPVIAADLHFLDLQVVFHGGVAALPGQRGADLLGAGAELLPDDVAARAAHQRPPVLLRGEAPVGDPYDPGQ